MFLPIGPHDGRLFSSFLSSFGEDAEALNATRMAGEPRGAGRTSVVRFKSALEAHAGASHVCQNFSIKLRYVFLDSGPGVESTPRLVTTNHGPYRR